MRLLLCILFWATPAWAEYRKTPGTRFDLGELTNEWKQVVPNLEGCDDERGAITCRRLTGDFTVAEQAAMDAALASHDPDARAQRKAALQQSRQDAIQKLEALGLTKQELDALVGD